MQHHTTASATQRHRDPAENQDLDRDPSRNPGRARNHRRWAAIVPPAITIALVLLVWQLAADAHLVSATTLASPAQIVSSLADTWPDLLAAAAITTGEALWGFAISIVAGVAIGMGLYLSKTVNRALYPLLVAAQTIPIITVAPLFIIWFGFDEPGKIILIAVFGVFSIAVETSRGLGAVPRFYQDVALTCGAGRAWTLFHVKLRVAARQIFSGIRISAAYVFGTAVTAEYLGARNGIGVWLQGAFNSFQTPMIFSAAVVVVSETGILLALVSLAERLLLGPADDDDAASVDESEA
ncbi:ABC transporter permease [Bifidobacterium sp. ESL0763]|uniref:ABC transporter permease n=1 Tax=Bifidobacterium sp. ESL0763 TaxID=2983227 RepID=UPI0023F63642|nr:ABC transporter permease [Bifidobacterium sp. ESL0763]MDF7664393.1 ABC transporter permease [Bifidobacterium sp. ESL0763]